MIDLDLTQFLLEIRASSLFMPFGRVKLLLSRITTNHCGIMQLRPCVSITILCSRRINALMELIGLCVALGLPVRSLYV